MNPLHIDATGSAINSGEPWICEDRS